MRPVVVLRPEPGASATVERARGRGLEPIAAPLFEIEPVPWETPPTGSFDGLLLTSANALRCAGGQIAHLRGLPVHAVGAATAEAAREAGFDVASTGDCGVDRLLASIEPEFRLLHLCGEDRHEPDCPRQAISSVAVYRARPIEAPALAGVRDAVALVHSPRGGQRLALMVTDRRGWAVAAISAAAAEPVGDGWGVVEVANFPNDDALLALAARLCNKPPPE